MYYYTNVLGSSLSEESIKPASTTSYYRKERSFGKTNRSYKLPFDCDSTGDVKVKFLDGVLCCVFNKIQSSTSTTKKLVIHSQV